MGEMLAATDRVKGQLKHAVVGHDHDEEKSPTLADLDVSKNESSHAQKLAALPEAKKWIPQGRGECKSGLPCRQTRLQDARNTRRVRATAIPAAYRPLTHTQTPLAGDRGFTRSETHATFIPLHGLS